MKRSLTLNMGPQHPSTHGVLRVILEIDGEMVIKAVPDIGYLHRGVEKLAENRTYEQFLPFTDRLDYTAAMSNNLAYIQAVEKLAGLEVPRRARLIRVMMAELTRISAHLIWLGTHALDLGAMTPLFYCFREREEIWDIFEMVSGARMTNSYLRLGGVSRDVGPAAVEAVAGFCRKFPGRVDEYERLLTKNPIYRKRTIGLGEVSAADAADLGLLGPVARASGVDWDLRRDEPYAAYDEVTFEVPLGSRGDVYDRYLVRVAEMRQSVRIIEQALRLLPEGPVRADDPRFIRPPKDRIDSGMENLIRYFYLAAEGPAIPAGEVYSAIESPKGELGYFIVSDGSSRPARVKIRPPSFVNLSALPRLIEGGYLADVVAIIGSMDVVMGEVDR